MTIQEFKSQAIKTLSKTSPSASLDTNVLLEHFLQKDKTWILLHNQEELAPEVFDKLLEAIASRKTGLPIAYITGHKEFYGNDFYVTPAVLIPKADTEILVEKAIDLIKDKIYVNPEKILMVCDMCTGSGCIALSVLRALLDDPDIPFTQVPHFTLCDISPEALDVARRNAKKLFSLEEEERIRFVQSDLFYQVPWDFDAILTNPPYIPAKMVDELLKDGRREPRLALDGDIGEYGQPSDTNDGLDIIRRLIPQAYERLIHNGLFLMETGEYNADQAKLLCEQTGFRQTKTLLDLEGQKRVTFAIK
ncbi:MAG: peptide chain release factor N(5)-glutamine methyltransferase [Treponema sp.]|nr:peptide chain release factor N(5)-glutamine methyltransferase [Treponema sp.]